MNKPCPFCGLEIKPMLYAHHGYYHVVCNRCSANGPAGATSDEAKAAWNTRRCAQPIPAIDGAGVTLDQVEALAKAMWKGEPLPGRVLRFGSALLGLAENAAGTPQEPQCVEPGAYRELRELAAKAAGVDLENDNGPYAWDPLTNDGDALRLAVTLEMELDLWTGDLHATTVFYESAETGDQKVQEWHGDDKHAATRRAIVRAAAEVGRAQ